MKQITHTGKWPQPIVVTLKLGIHSHNRNLLVGESFPCEDLQVSRELLALEKKGFITITQLTPPAAPPHSDDMSAEEIAKLEEELLNVDGSDAVSKEED